MSAIFVSHSSRDNALTATIAERLKERGYTSLFLDFDPADGIPAGRNWEQELYQHLRSCRAVIVLCSDNSMRSDWCFVEITHAKLLGKHLFPLKVAPCEIRSNLRDLQVIDMTVDVEQGYIRLWNGLQLAGLDPRELFHWSGERPPYPGLMAFQEADAPIFFGRDADIRASMDILNRLRRFGGPSLVLIVGASGSGKTSLVRAGLLPRIQKDPDAFLVVDPFRPLDRPFEEFALTFTEAMARYGERPDWRALRERIHAAAETKEAAAAQWLELIRDLRIASSRRSATVLATVDQFEELLGPGSADDIDRFLSFLQAGLQVASNAKDSPLILLGTLRSDFLGDFQNHPLLRQETFEDLPVGPLSVDGFAQVIEGPAKVVGLLLDDGLVPRMVADTDTEQALPLLAFTLRELWERYGQDGDLTVEEYRDKLGGLEGSLERAAEAVLTASQPSSEQEAGLRKAFRSMVRINEAGQYARQQVHWDALPVESHPLLERFVDARLLVAGVGKEGRDRTLDVTHEALFRAWAKLRHWLDDDREFLIWRQRLQAAEDEYTHTKTLLRGDALREAEKWLRQRDSELSSEGRELIELSITQRGREEAAARRRRRAIVGGLAAGLVIAAILTAITTWQSREAERQRDAARQAEASAVENEIKAVAAAKETEAQRRVALAGLSRYLAAESADARETRPQKALLLALEAVRVTRDVDDSVTTVAERALHDALESAGGKPLSSSSGYIESAVFSLDSRWLALAGKDSHVELWNPADLGAAPRKLDSGIQGAARVVFSPRGNWVAVEGGEPAELRLLRLDSEGDGQVISLAEFSEPIDKLVFSPDEQWLVATDNDAQLRLWRLTAPETAPLLLAGHTPVKSYDGTKRVVMNLAFSPDGRWLVTNGHDDTTRLWDMTNPSESRLLLQETQIAYSSSPHFSSDGHWLAQTLDTDEASWAKRVLVWSLEGGGVEQVALGEAPIPSPSFEDVVVEFHPTQPLLLTQAGTNLYLWDLDHPITEAKTVPGYRGAFSPDGRWLATVAAEDVDGPRHRVRLRDTTRPEGHPYLLTAFESEISELVFSPDGQHLVTVGMYGRRMTLSRGESFTNELKGHEDSVVSVMFSPDGRWLLSMPSWKRGMARLWWMHNTSNHPVTVRYVLQEPELEYKTSSGGGSGVPVGGLPDALAYDEKRRWVAMPGGLGVALLVALDRPYDEPVVLGDPQRRAVTAIKFLPGGDRVAVADWNHRVRLWNSTRPNASPVEFPGLKSAVASSVSAMAVSRDGRWIATGDLSGRVVLRETNDPTTEPGEPQMLRGHRGPITSIRFSADSSRLVTAGADGYAKVWKVSDPRAEPLILQEGTGRQSSIRAEMSADGRWIVTAGQDALIRLWQMDRLATDPILLRGHSEAIISIAVSSDDRRLATSSEDGTVRVWSLQDPELEPTILPSPVPIANVVTFDPGTKRLVAGGIDGSVSVWTLGDLDRPAVDMTFRHTDEADKKEKIIVWAARYSPDGKWLTALAAGKALLWRVHMDERIDFACRTAGRNLTVGEWEHYIEGIPYRLTCPQWGPDPYLRKKARRLAEAGKVERAATLFEYVKTLSPDPDIEPRREAVRLAVQGRLNMGRRLAREGKTDAALAELHRIRRIAPDRTLDPEREIERVLTAQTKVKEANDVAKSGNFAEAEVLFAEALTLDPGLELDPKAESRRLYAPRLKQEGLNLASSGRMDDAIAKLAGALEYDPKLRFDPENTARSARAQTLSREGRKLAERGRLEAAIEKYRQALAVNTDLRINPVAEAKRRMAPFLVEQGERRFMAEDYSGAMESLDRALEYDSKARIYASTWNQLCWDGSLHNHALEVMAACERAVNLAPENGGYRDSRGVARALTGDISGAIKDFTAYVSWASENRRSAESIQKRKRWIEALQRGERPARFKELEALNQP